MPPETPGKKVLVYDPNRRPQDWVGLLSRTAVAVFLSDVNSGHELNERGEDLVTRDGSFCYIFPSKEEAEPFCHVLVNQFPYLQCEMFDHRGRAVDPVAVHVHPSSRRARDDDPRRAKWLLTAGIVIFLANFPLFYWDWTRSGHLIWPSFIAVNCVGLGLRLIYWGGNVLARQRKQSKPRVDG